MYQATSSKKLLRVSSVMCAHTFKVASLLALVTQSARADATALFHFWTSSTTVDLANVCPCKHWSNLGLASRYLSQMHWLSGIWAPTSSCLTVFRRIIVTNNQHHVLLSEVITRPCSFQVFPQGTFIHMRVAADHGAFVFRLTVGELGILFSAGKVIITFSELWLPSVALSMLTHAPLSALLFCRISEQSVLVLPSASQRSRTSLCLVGSHTYSTPVHSVGASPSVVYSLPKLSRRLGRHLFLMYFS